MAIIQASSSTFTQPDNEQLLMLSRTPADFTTPLECGASLPISYEDALGHHHVQWIPYASQEYEDYFPAPVPHVQNAGQF